MKTLHSPDGAGSAPLGDPRTDRDGSVHGRPRCCDRQRSPPVDQERPALLTGQPAVGDYRVLDPLRWRADARRPPLRPARAQAPIRDRPRPVQRELAAGRSGVVGAVADRLPLPPGPRRGARIASGAVDPDDDLPGGTRAQRRARRLGRCLRQRRRHRRAAGRRPHEWPRLVVDLLRQCPGRHRRHRGDPVPAARERRRTWASALRLHGRGIDHRRLDVARLRNDPCRAARLGHD